MMKLFLFFSLIFNLSIKVSAALPAEVKQSVMLHPLNISLLAGINLANDSAPIEENTSTFGVSAEYLWKLSHKRFFSVKSDFLTENSSSSEGGFSMGISRNAIQEWGIFSWDFVNSCQCTFGLGLGVGMSQTQVRSSIETSSVTSTGQLEPITGFILDSKVLATDRLYFEFIARKTFANNFTAGTRNELSVAVGVSFF